MNLEELLTRPQGVAYSVEEASFLVEQYIKDATGQDVKVNIYKNMPNPANLNPFGQIILQNEHQKLFSAFSVALDELLKKKHAQKS